MKLVKDSRYNQGIYRPANPSKYIGTTPIVYRSGLELKMFRFLDNASSVTKWSSESVVIPYEGVDGKIHRYFVDFACEMVRNDGRKEKYLIEIKPHRQTIPPIPSGKKSKKTTMYENYQWATNNLKWDAAKKWCEKKGYKFWIVTDLHLDK